MKALKYFFCLLIISSSLSGCKKETSSEKERPVINSISLNLSQATPGTKISVTGAATDPQGDQLTYTWSSEQGTISNPNNSATDWVISPTCLSNSNAKITLTVSDGKVSSSLEKEIPIIMGVTVSGKAIYKGTSIPLSDVNIKMGPFSTMTIADGTFVIFHIAPGANTLEASKSGFDAFVDSEDISTDKVFTISMTSGSETRTIYGSVKTIDSIPLNGIRVIMLNDDMTESTLNGITDIDGKYQISNIPQGTRYFKFVNESNSNNCQPVTNNIEVAGVNEKLNVRMKIQRQIDILQNGWEFKTSDLSAPFNGTSYVLTTDGSNPTITVKLLRPAYCCPIPVDADNPQVVLIHKITGTLKTPGQLYYKSPASTQFYMTSDCSGWPDYTSAVYTYWSSNVTSFLPDYLSISASYKGKSLKLTFGLFRWSGTIPLWEIKSLVVTYYY